MTTAIDTSTAPTNEIWTETWTTTVTFCKHCGPIGSTVTRTIPYIPSGPVTKATISGASRSLSGQEAGATSTGASGPTGGVPLSSAAAYSTSKAAGAGPGSVRPTSQTPGFTLYASKTVSYETAASTTSAGSGEGVAPVFNGSGSQSGLINFAGAFLDVFISAAVLI